MYYKIINKKWNHHGYQYVPGLNILQEQFNDNSSYSCCAGGFYFTTINHIFKFLDFGCYLVEVILPTSDSDFKMVSDPEDIKFRSNKIILGNKYDLTDITTIQMMIDLGADVHADDDYALRWASENGHLEVVEFLVGIGFDIHANNDYAFRIASENGHVEVVKFLVKIGADIHASNDYALRLASANGRLEVVMFLVEKVGVKFNVHSICDALQWARQYEHMDVVHYLDGKGVKDNVDDDYPSSSSTSEIWHLDMVLMMINFYDEHRMGRLFGSC